MLSATMTAAQSTAAPVMQSADGEIADSTNHRKIGGRTSQAAGLTNPDYTSIKIKPDLFSVKYIGRTTAPQMADSQM